MKINQLLEAKKGVKAPKYSTKPRNFVAKNMTTGGAGAHKDKKKADKQGDVKHKAKVLAEGALDELHADLSDKFNEIAPSITKYKDQQGATQLYNELVAVAKQHGPAGVQALKSMLNGARNNAHMDYDTNPGGFENWFWYLPLGDDQSMSEEGGVVDTVKGIATKVGDALSTALPQDMRPFDNQTAAKNVGYKGKIKEDDNSKDVVSVDVPLLIRLLEYAREDAKTDMDLHDVAERLIALSQEGRTLSMQDYDQICPSQDSIDESAEYDDETGMAANQLQTIQRCAKDMESSLIDGENLPEWVQSKITIAKEHLVTAFDYVLSQHQNGEMDEAMTNPDTMSATDYDRYQQNQMDQEKRDFKSREMHHELDHEERGMYFVVIAKNGKWEYTKAQPRQEGMNAAQRVINSLHAKYPSMHLGMMGPDGKVYNHGKGK